MLTVEEALQLVMERSTPLPAARRALSEAAGCVLAEDVVSDLDSPPFDKALVDGYAVRSTDLLGGDRWLRLGEEITAGRTPTRPLGPREAAAIVTGAPPPGGRRRRDARAHPARVRPGPHRGPGGRAGPEPPQARARDGGRRRRPPPGRAA